MIKIAGLFEVIDVLQEKIAKKLNILLNFFDNFLFAIFQNRLVVNVKCKGREYKLNRIQQENTLYMYNRYLPYDPIVKDTNNNLYYNCNYNAKDFWYSSKIEHNGILLKKNIFISVILLISMAQISFAQDEDKKFEPGGKATGKVFFNYHYDLTKNVEKKSQFELLRSYFGYNYNISENFKTKVLFDVGTNNGGSSYTAFLKYASLAWKINDMVSVEGGLIPTQIFCLQEHFWGYRYIYKSEQDEDKYYSSADLGAKLSFKPAKMLEFHAGLYNGEGYKKIQDNFGTHKVSVDMEIRPVEGLVFKTYYDMMNKRDTASGVPDSLMMNQSILNFFLGYEKKDLFKIGIEYNMLNNYKHTKDHSLGGFSGYGTYIFSKKVELFVRYDMLASNTLTGATDPWNISKDYSMFLTGV